MFLKRYYIAVGFDGTLVEHRFPNVGRIKNNVISKLSQHCNDLINDGFNPIIILWTCREGKYLDVAKDWCKNNLPEIIQPTFYNENPDIHRKYSICRKIYADEYWDDKSVIND